MTKVIELPKIKKESSPDFPLTPEQEAEYERCAFSLEYFLSNYVYIQNPTMGGSVLFEPREYQKDIGSLVEDNNFVIINAPRQTGKSTIMAGILLWYAIFQDDTKIGISANKKDAAREIMERIQYAYEEMDYWLKPVVKDYNKFSMSFDNGSKIEAGATTESGFRGKSFSIIYLDEFAHIKPSIAEAFWVSLLPTITGAGSASKSKVLITSTPNGTEGLFAQLWFGAVHGDNGFVHYQVRPEQVEGRDEKFKQSMLKKMSETKYLQEYEGAFLSSKETLIASMVLESIKKKDAIWEFTKGFNIFEPEEYFQGKRLGIAIDVSAGVGSDYHAIQVFDLDTLVQVGEYRNNTMTQTDFANQYIKFLDKMYELGVAEIYYTVESNSYGLGVLNLLETSTARSLVRPETTLVTYPGNKTLGTPSTPATKRKGCAKLKDLVESHVMTLRSERLVTELKFFVKAGAAGFKAESGMHDDLAMACVVFANMLEAMAEFDEVVFDKMHRIGDAEDSLEDAPLPFVF